MSERYRQLPLFAALDDTQLEAVGAGSRDVAFSAGEVLFRRGGAARSFYVVENGHVALEIVSPGSPPFVVETLGPSSVLGWSWLFPPYRWQFDARALESGTATEFDGARVRAACESDPALGYELMGRFSHLIIERLQFARLRLLDVYGNAAR